MCSYKVVLFFVQMGGGGGELESLYSMLTLTPTPLTYHLPNNKLPVIKVKDLLDTFNCGCGPFCVSLQSDTDV